MSIIKLKNVSKFYYNKGLITSGFNKVNLEFNIGEFVAITGESGSGKSTLLNVISGLDSYEEGEMYINGEETSHYTEKDFEDYRRKYIGNVFQNFNLVNSYTVYQNIELVLLLNGNKRKDIKNKILELIKEVGLVKFKNTKVSKLSGGQKQRVAIARALAKDTPIIIADEPTGNLDSKAANQVMELLYNISKEKLVIVVTHNYEIVEKYVTRVIKMHDGKALEDKTISKVQHPAEIKLSKFDNITKFNEIRLSFRNAFNIIPKFLLVLAVYLFISVSLISEYSSFKKLEHEESITGSNYIFNNTNENRIVIKHNDNSAISEENYKEIEKLNNVNNIEKNDLLIDTAISFSDAENFWLSGYINDISNFNSKVDIGRMPENDNEVIVEGDKNNYYLSDNIEKLFNTELTLNDDQTGQNANIKIKIVGIKYKSNSDSYYMNFYISPNKVKELSFGINRKYSSLSIEINNKEYYTEKDIYFQIVASTLVPNNHAYISENLSFMCKNNSCKKEPLKINVNNTYYNDSLNTSITGIFTKNNISKLLNINDYDMYTNTIFINESEFNNLYNKGNFQSSVFVKNTSNIYETESQLNEMGYKTLVIKDTLVSNSGLAIIRIIRTIVTIILIVVLFFISYFVINIILKSRNVYFSTIRMLGANLKISKQLLINELLIDTNIAFILFMSVILLNYFKVLNIKYFNTIIEYLKITDYLLVYTILITMSYLISKRFSKKLFKKSVISTISEEA